MNVLTRGVKNTLRSPIRSGAIVLMFAISIALIVSMLVARGSVLAKINEVKATAGTAVTIRPAGTMGPFGGGDPLTADQLNKIKTTDHISSTTMTLTDQLSSDNTTLASSLQFGGFGRAQREGTSSAEGTSPSGDSTAMPTRTPGITVTGTTDANSVATDGGALNITSGSAIDASGNANEALLGSDLASKNNLKAGDTFTAYGATITVKGIYTTNNRFQDSGMIMPLATVQTLTNQAGVVSTVVATVDSSDNVASTVASLKSSLGDSADITSEVQRAEASVTSLESIAALALAGVIAAAIAGAAIVLLAMITIVRERRREIGVMKAIGGTDGKVVGQFITEGLTLTVFGAIIGMVLGIIVSGPMTTSLVASKNSSNASTVSTNRQARGAGGFVSGGFRQLQDNATQVTATLTPTIIATSIGVTIFISLIGTAIPAWFTARVRPAEVLRTE